MRMRTAVAAVADGRQTSAGAWLGRGAQGAGRRRRAGRADVRPADLAQAPGADGRRSYTVLPRAAAGRRAPGSARTDGPSRAARPVLSLVVYTGSPNTPASGPPGVAEPPKSRQLRRVAKPPARQRSQSFTSLSTFSLRKNRDSPFRVNCAWYPALFVVMFPFSIILLISLLETVTYVMPLWRLRRTKT